MPVVYETAAPVQAEAQIANDLAFARRRAELNAANPYGHGGGYGGGGGIIDDGSTQNAVFARNQQMFREAQDSLNRTGVNNSDYMQAFWASERQRDHFQLQAELQQTELTQQEQMRLTRMKNAVGEISNDPTLADDEKASIITKLKTGIDPMEQRLAKERVQSQAQERQQHAELYQLDAALKKQQMDALSKSADEASSVVYDPQALSEIAQDFRESHGFAARLIPDQIVQQIARQEAMKQGLFVHGHRDIHGNFKPVDFGDKAGKGGGKLSAATGVNSLTLDQYMKVYENAVKEVTRQANETEIVDGEKKLVRPDLKDEHVRRGAIETELRSRGLPVTVAAFADTIVQPDQPGGRKKFDRSQSPWGKSDTQTKPQVETVSTPAESKPGKSGIVSPSALGELDVNMNKISQATGISDQEKMVALELLRASKTLATAASQKDRNPENWPEDVREKLARYAKDYAAIASRAQYSQPQPPTATPPTPNAAPFVGGETPRPRTPARLQ